jgi:hypothetical protein
MPGVTGQLSTAEPAASLHYAPMTITDEPRLDGILEELESQGVLIKSHNESNRTWFVKGEGIFTGYVVTSEELIELKRVDRLNLHGIKSLG